MKKKPAEVKVVNFPANWWDRGLAIAAIIIAILSWYQAELSSQAAIDSLAIANQSLALYTAEISKTPNIDVLISPPLQEGRPELILFIFNDGTAGAEHVRVDLHFLVEGYLADPIYEDDWEMYNDWTGAYGERFPEKFAFKMKNGRYLPPANGDSINELAQIGEFRLAVPNGSEETPIASITISGDAMPKTGFIYYHSERGEYEIRYSNSTSEHIRQWNEYVAGSVESNSSHQTWNSEQTGY